MNIVSIIVPERGNVPLPDDLVVVGSEVYRITAHRGLCHDSRASFAPGSGAANEWRFDAVLVGDIEELTQDEYETAPAGYLDIPEEDDC